MPIPMILLAATWGLLPTNVRMPKLESRQAGIHLARSAAAAEPFSLGDVRITGGPFAVANKACADYLLTVEPDRLLHGFRVNSGLKPKAQIYRGWESLGLAGHSLGHYLSACSQQWASSGDHRFKDKVDYIVGELAECQRNRPDGYIAAMPDGDRVWAEVKRGEIRSHGFDLNGLWSPWYTHHKVLAGLVDAYRWAGNRDALAVAEKFADWAVEETKNLTDDQWQQMLACEYGGMNDALADLYALTGKAAYLDLARKFYDRRVLDPLSKEQDDLSGKHSNTQIPKIIGLARLYEVSGDAQDAKTAEFFWETVVRHHTYAIGGNSNHEYLGPPDQLADRLSSNTCESCNTYNMLKLTRHLFEWDPRVEYADYYERAHLNHVLASQDPDDGMMTYFMPLASGSHRTYSNPENDWTCCHGSGMESHTKHADSIYFHHGRDRLYVTQFIPSELNWKEAGVRLVQATRYPDDGVVSLSINAARPRKFEILIRHPGWASEGIWVTVNGKLAAISDKPGTFISVSRTWRSGDHIDFAVPMRLRTEPMPDDPRRVAILYGPLVFAADLGENHGPMPRTPVLLPGDRPITEWLHRKWGGDLAFRTANSAKPTDLTLLPFYTIHHNRYATYFDEFTDAQWKQAEADYRAEEARRRDLEARTIDTMRIGEMQPERDHQLKSERNDVREANGRGFRTPLERGWFEFEMKVDPTQAVDLVMTYWGNERANPEFEIFVDGQKLVEETLPHRANNRFFDEVRPLPDAMTHGKTKITIRIQAIAGKTAGPVAGARIVRRS